MFTLATTKHFDKSFKTFVGQHPDLKKKIAGVFRQLEKDPFEPSLKLHPLRGQLQGIMAVSITYKYRLILTLKITPKEIILLDVGTHDELYR